MNKDTKHLIEEIDQLITKSEKINYQVYRRLDESYIKSSFWPFGIYRNLQKHSEIRMVPSFSPKRWMTFLLKKNKNKQEFLILLGPLMGWFFLEKKKFKSTADFIFLKKFRKGLILLYDGLGLVVKAKLFCDIDNTRPEYERTKYAYEKGNGLVGVHIPAVLNHKYVPLKYSFFTMKQIRDGKSLNLFPSSVRKKYFQQVVDFLFKWYQEHGVDLKNPIVDFDFMRKIIYEFHNDNAIYKFEVIEKYYEDLLNQDKKIFWSITHGDIHSRQLILDKKRNLWLIDWQSSKYEPIAMDFRKLKRDGNLFDKLLTLFPDREGEIMDHSDQIFIGHLRRLERGVIQFGKRRGQQVDDLISLCYDHLRKGNLLKKP